jgi:hypothetical protein
MIKIRVREFEVRGMTGEFVLMRYETRKAKPTKKDPDPVEKEFVDTTYHATLEQVLRRLLVYCWKDLDDEDIKSLADLMRVNQGIDVRIQELVHDVRLQLGVK